MERSARLARGGSWHGLALSRRGSPAGDRARQQGAEEQDRDWNHERGTHGVDEGLGKHVMREPLHLRRFGSRNTPRERHSGLAASDLEHAARRFGKALHKWQPKWARQARGLRLRLADELVREPGLQDGANDGTAKRATP